MRIAPYGAFALAALTIAATCARADDTNDDVRCLALAAAITADPNVDANGKSAGQMVAFYYLGRLDGRTPGIEIKSRFIEQAKVIGAMPPDAIKAQAEACGVALGARGKELQDLGDALKAANQPPK